VFRVLVTSGVEDALAMAEDALGGGNVGRVMRAACADGAAYEKANHHYVNRTGNAQRLTRARTIENTNGRAAVEIVAGAEYASYLYRAGFTELDYAAGQTRIAIELALDDLSKRAAGVLS
jgi:hypothetical protein